MTQHLEIFKRYDIEPKKSLGQNFLINDDFLEAIATAESLNGKHVIEVGPGYGALTQRILAQKPASLTLVEYDPIMVGILQNRQMRGELVIPVGTEFTIKHQDILQFQPERTSIVVANIPYYITSPIISRFLYEVEYAPTAMVILMQQEVGDKIRETRGFKSSYLSMTCQNRCTTIHESLRVAPANFFPPPKVDSSVLCFEVAPRSRDTISESRFLSILSAGFAHPRKLLVSNLSHGNAEKKKEIQEIFTKMGISEMVRPADLSLTEWHLIAERLS